MKTRNDKVETEFAVQVNDGLAHWERVLKWKVPHIFHTSPTFMDYLHGDVLDEESWPAYIYEYHRESRAAWEAAQKRDEKVKSGLPVEDAAIFALQNISMIRESNVLPYGLGLLCCSSFPRKDWQELSREERAGIMRTLPGDGVRLLRIVDAWELVATGQLEKFKKLGDVASPVVAEVLPGHPNIPLKLVPAMLQKHGSVHTGIFDIDFSKSETSLVNQFKEWLRLPENRERRETCKREKSGTTGRPLDRLKELAALRLYREFNNDLDAANKFANGRRKQYTSAEIRHRFRTKEKRKAVRAGGQRPFRDAKRQGATPAAKADLFGEEADARKAKATVLDVLRELVPSEFRPPDKGETQAAMQRLKNYTPAG